MEEIIGFTFQNTKEERSLHLLKQQNNLHHLSNQGKKTYSKEDGRRKKLALDEEMNKNLLEAVTLTALIAPKSKKEQRVTKKMVE